MTNPDLKPSPELVAKLVQECGIAVLLIEPKNVEVLTEFATKAAEWGAQQKDVSVEMIECACGDMYPHNSYGAGYIDALGHCPNCEAGSAQQRGVVTPEQLADAFMGVRVPETFHPDCGISFDRHALHPASWPTGTNLLTVAEATEMFRETMRRAAIAAAKEKENSNE